MTLVIFKYMWFLVECKVKYILPYPNILNVVILSNSGAFTT